MPERKTLSHDVPFNAATGPDAEVFFITICCVPRGRNQLANENAWQAILETIANREAQGKFICQLLLAMPDHLHGFFRFPHVKDMPGAINSLKSWLARSHGIHWQRGFFDHRLRTWESAAEKASYIRQNPVRAGLAPSPSAWPYLRER